MFPVLCCYCVKIFTEPKICFPSTYDFLHRTKTESLTWQVQEGVNIVTEPPKHSGMEVFQMNSKLEYLQGTVPQTRTQQGTVS